MDMNYETMIKKLLSESAYVEAPFLEKYKSPMYPKVIEEKEQADYFRLPKAPLVSVLVLAYNKAEWIRECVMSLLGQQTSFEYEIVIAEDCSTSRSPSRIPAPVVESPSTRTKYVAAGRFTRSSFRSSGGSWYCSDGDGKPATTDPDILAFADMFFNKRFSDILTYSRHQWLLAPARLDLV